MARSFGCRAIDLTVWSRLLLEFQVPREVGNGPDRTTLSRLFQFEGDYRLPQQAHQLTDDEGTFLSLLVRVQPATAYQIAKIYEDSPVSNFGTSKGKIYPMLRRLKEKGLLTSRALDGDARRSEVLKVTARGRDAVRHWLLEIKPSYLLPEDPFRTRVQSFDLLSKEEQLEWIAEAKAGLEAKLVELEDYRSTVHVPHKDLLHDNAISSIEGRLAWLDRVHMAIGGRVRAAGKTVRASKP